MNNTIEQANKKMSEVLNSNRVEDLTFEAEKAAIREMSFIVNYQIETLNYQDSLNGFKTDLFKRLIETYNNSFTIKGKSDLELAENYNKFAGAFITKRNMEFILAIANRLMIANKNFKDHSGDYINVVDFELNVERLNNADNHELEVIRSELFEAFNQYESPEYLFSCFAEIGSHLSNTKYIQEFYENKDAIAA